MKKSLLMKTMLLLCALVVGSISSWATDYTYTFTSKVYAAKGPQTLNDVSWTMSGTGGDYFGYDGTKGQQFGSGSKPYSALSLSTSGIDGTITSVVVNTSGANSIAGTVAVSVGSTDFLCNSKTTASLTTTATNYTFTGSASGNIVISWAQTSSKAIYVKSITVTYSTATKADPELSFSEATYYATYGVDFTSPTLHSADGFNGTVEYESSDPSVARLFNTETGELIIAKGGETTITATFEGDNNFKAGSASYTLIVTDTRIATTTTQDNIVLDLADVATLTRLAPIVKNASDNVVAYQYDAWPTEMSFEIVSDDNSMIGSIDNNTGEITLNAVTGTATLKAFYNYFGVNTTYQPSECTFTITVIDPLDNIAALTAETETGTYQVNLTDAVVTFVSGNYAYIQDASGAVAMYKSDHGLTAGDVLTGTATVTYQLKNSNPQITALSGVTPVAGVAPDPVSVAQADWTYTFADVLSQYIKVTGATITKSGTKYYVTLGGDNIQLYKTGGSIADLNLSKKYSITGFPTLYNSTKELQIFADPEEEIGADPTISATPASLTDFTYAEGQGPSTAKTITVSGANLTANISLAASTNYEISLSENSGYASNLELTQSAGAVASTTIYVRLKADLSKADYNGTVTLTSTGADDVEVTLTGNVTRDFATLPFTFDGGIADIADTDGLSQEGLGSDYASSPKLKFNGTGDYVILKFNEAAEYLAFDIKGNSFADGTFKVQTSADGENFTDLETYTELGATETEAFADIASDVRYIKWIYTNKEDGNVALGNIKLTNDANDVVAITVSDAGLATFASDSKLDFKNVKNLEAYIAKENGSKIELTKVNKVPAGAGVLLRALNSATSFRVPVTTAAASVTGNIFVRGNDAAVETGTGPYNYVLGKKSGVVGFYKANGATVTSDKAYLQTTLGSAARIDINFDDATAIEAVKAQNVENGQFFNLAGQRVAQPTKGLYIVNGKKVIIK